ncbi:MAG: hypothetical protein ACRC30_10380 [Clostridium sp.]
MKKLICLVLGIIIVVTIGGSIYYKYETKYINGINPYQKEINKILGINEPIFNSRNAKNALKPVYGAIINAYELRTYRALNTICIMNINLNSNSNLIEQKIEKQQIQQAENLMKKNQIIMKNMIEFSENNNINYLKSNQLEKFYQSIQKCINSGFNMKIIEEVDKDNKQLFNNVEFKKISEGYMNDIQRSTKKYPDLKKNGKYYLVIWNNAQIAFSSQKDEGEQISFDTVNVE